MKPQYSIPSMEQIKKIPWNGYNCISTFSGGGGSSTGYRMAGYKVLYANEFIEAAQDTYKANKADYTILDGRDIRTVTGADILEKINLKKGELDLFDGSPPCASFSTAGKRHKQWGETKKYSDSKQRADDLFFEFSRLINDIQPKTFIAENVSGLVKGTAKGYFKEILIELKNCGYRVEAKLLNSAFLGVPQARERVIFVGVRTDLGLVPKFPKPLDYYYTIEDAWKNIKEPPEKETNVDKYSIKKLWYETKLGKQHPKRFNLVRPHPKKPSPTMMATQTVGAAQVMHPLEPRALSISEVKRICSFPDDYVLTGNFGQKKERMGRSVPPLMMKAISQTVKEEILDKI